MKFKFLGIKIKADFVDKICVLQGVSGKTLLLHALRAYLRRRGNQVFYLDRNNVKNFFQNGELNVDAIVALSCDKDFILLDEVDSYNFETGLLERLIQLNAKIIMVLNNTLELDLLDADYKDYFIEFDGDFMEVHRLVPEEG